MKFVYLIQCVYMSDNYRKRGEYSNIVFKTEKEAIHFCNDRSDNGSTYTWTPIAVGKYISKNKQKKLKK